MFPLAWRFPCVGPWIWPFLESRPLSIDPARQVHLRNWEKRLLRRLKSTVTARASELYPYSFSPYLIYLQINSTDIATHISLYMYLFLKIFLLKNTYFLFFKIYFWIQYVNITKKTSKTLILNKKIELLNKQYFNHVVKHLKKKQYLLFWHLKGWLWFLSFYSFFFFIWIMQIKKMRI